MMNKVSDEQGKWRIWGIFGIVEENYAEGFNTFKFYINLLLLSTEHFCMLHLIYFP